jgi:hypothetical protein
MMPDLCDENAYRELTVTGASARIICAAKSPKALVMPIVDDEEAEALV